jgi:hypothetical protein
MRRTLLLLAAAGLAVLLLIAAPALSVRPYQPRAVDFELASPALHASRGGPVESPQLQAPKRFNLVGLRWSGRGEPPRISIRFRRDGGAWSPWTQVGAGHDHAPDPGTGEANAGGNSDPVWVGEADHVQYRLSRRVDGLRLHFVNTKGTATAGDRLRTAVRDAASTGMRTIAGLIGVRAAGAQDPQPEIVPRSAWEGGQCTPRSAPAYREVKLSFVHHTVNPNEYAAEDVPSMMLAMCRYHRNSNGWNDLGYNFVVDRFGRIWEGRAGGVDKPVVGAHTEGMNTQSFGVSNLGTYTDVPVTEEAMQALTRLMRWKLPLHGQPTSGPVTVVSNGGGGSHFAAGEEATLDRISGHRDANATSCPGEALYAQLPDLRNRAAGAPVQERPAPAVTLRRPAKKIAKGTNVKMRGAIDPRKESVSVLLEKKKGQKWARWFGRTVTTRADGTFLKKVRFRHEGLYRVTALFGGDGANGPARSRTYYLRVPHRGGTTSSEPPPEPYSDPSTGGAGAG